MGRLLDADVIEDTLRNLANKVSSESAIGLNLAVLELRNIPTAYDVDAVVEELEKEKRPLKEAVVANRISISINNELIKIKNSDIDKYIAIVRKGGANE